jgi:hypothetical protein
VAALSLPRNLPALAVGQSTQIAAVVKDGAGNILSTAAVAWSSSSSSVATVSASGVVTAKAPGNATVKATSGNVTDSTTVTVSSTPAPPPPTPSIGGSAALPTTLLDTPMPSAPAAGGQVINVPSGGDLQAALNQAQPGDVVQLAAGASFTGNFTLPKKSNPNSKWIVIRAAVPDAQLPAEGARMTPQIAQNLNLPKVLTPNSTAVFTTAAGADHYRLVGFEVSATAAPTVNYVLVAIGVNETKMADVPHDFVIDRMYVHGTPTLSLSRCLLLNSIATAVIDSWVSECHAQGSDAQAIEGWGGPGPFKIVNNYLEGSGENIMFGGADPAIPGVVPSDIEIRRNHVAKPTSWIGGPWSIKNLLELKSAQRVLIEGNVFEGSWAQSQTGYGILMKSSNQSGTCTWCITQDVTFRFNIVRNVGGGIGLAAAPDPYPAQLARRLTVSDNIIQNINTGSYVGDGRGFQIMGNLADVTVAHNTLVSPTSVFMYAGANGDTLLRFNVRDNVSSGGTYGYIGDNFAGLTAWTHYVVNGTMTGNVIAMAALGTSYPTGNFYPTSMSAVGFVDLAGGNFRLASTSPHKGQASDGRDPGADIDAVTSKTQGVVIP